MSWLEAAVFYAVTVRGSRPHLFAHAYDSVVELDQDAFDEAGEILEFGEIEKFIQECKRKNITREITKSIEKLTAFDGLDSSEIRVEKLRTTPGRMLPGVRIPVYETAKTKGLAKINKEPENTSRLRTGSTLIGQAPRRRRDKYASAICGTDEIDKQKAVDRFFSLEDSIHDVFSFVAPCDQNLNTIGFEIDNAYYLVCMECESNWKWMLRETSCTNLNPRTENYIRFLIFLGANQWRAKVSSYGFSIESSPFENKRNSDGLMWFKKYSKFKHDRLNNQASANLSNLIDAFSALYITLCIRDIIVPFERSTRKYSSTSRLITTCEQRIFHPEECFFIPNAEKFEVASIDEFLKI